METLVVMQDYQEGLVFYHKTVNIPEIGEAEIKDRRVQIDAKSIYDSLVLENELNRETMEATTFKNYVHILQDYKKILKTQAISYLFIVNRTKCTLYEVDQLGVANAIIQSYSTIELPKWQTNEEILMEDALKREKSKNA